MKVAVVYAAQFEQIFEELEVPEGTTAEQALRLSSIPARHPEIDPAVNKLGIYAKVVKPETVLCEGDRVEVYRPLPKKERDPHAADDKKARIMAKKERLKGEGGGDEAAAE